MCNSLFHPLECWKTQKNASNRFGLVFPDNESDTKYQNLVCYREFSTPSRVAYINLHLIDLAVFF